MNLSGEGVAKRNVIISGQAIHSINKKPLASQIELTELNSCRITHQLYTNDQGIFNIKANTDLNFSLTAHRNGYFSSSENIDLTDLQTRDTLRTYIELIPINSSSAIRLNNIFFESGRAELLDISKSEILRLVAFMKKHPGLNIEIHGHTDNIGSPESNMALSKQRAMAGKAFIIKHNIPEHVVLINYFGESQPIKDNNTQTGRKANRRVEIRFNQQIE